MSAREELARAIFANDLACGRVGCEWDDLDNETRDWFHDDADAAIAWFAARLTSPEVRQFREVLDAIGHEQNGWARQMADLRVLCYDAARSEAARARLDLAAARAALAAAEATIERVRGLRDQCVESYRVYNEECGTYDDPAVAVSALDTALDANGDAE